MRKSSFLTTESAHPIESVSLWGLIFTLLFLTACQTPYEPPQLKNLEPHQIQWTHLEDHEQLNGYFRLEDKIYCGEVAFNGWPMENVDAETFEVLAGTQYARDKNHVYYPLETICVDGEDWGCCYCTKYVMEDVDPLKFRYLNDEYARGEYLLFHRGKMTIPEGEKWISSQGKYEASDSSFPTRIFPRSGRRPTHFVWMGCDHGRRHGLFQDLHSIWRRGIRRF